MWLSGMEYSSVSEIHIDGLRIQSGMGRRPVQLASYLDCDELMVSTCQMEPQRQNKDNNIQYITLIFVGGLLIDLEGRIVESEKNRKLNDLLDALDFNQVVIFVKSVSRAAELNKLLCECNFPSICIHSGMTQEERFF